MITRDEPERMGKRVNGNPGNLKPETGNRKPCMFLTEEFERIKLPGAEGLKKPFWLSHRPFQICPAPTSSTDVESSSL